MKKRSTAEHLIESVGLTIHAKDGREKEIPLEVWQVDAIAFVLGLHVHLSDLNNYSMSNREQVDEIMDLLRNAIRNKYHKSN